MSTAASTAASVADWLRAGGIGVCAWAVIAVLAKVAADATGPSPAPRSSAAPEARPKRPAPAAPPWPIYPPSAGRHAAGPATASTSPSRVQPYLARHSRRPASWT
ncbi:hypothetical protein JL475_24520 [Streptomyces sp. M2CJ-2]|uniref:hypothetical protein n=1 Tax=Streptomyces sp. M2CJ-2 TaxID=2803948 RepID=UPI0019278386|nr:hypothetical protein [Streptomyces sp. M2CJ-2]MBL3669101.1 hypothetical protein [Streptomyces sp. M2CJ-2]